jgi:hypothetical protein
VLKHARLPASMPPFTTLPMPPTAGVGDNVPPPVHLLVIDRTRHHLSSRGRPPHPPPTTWVAGPMLGAAPPAVLNRHANCAASMAISLHVAITALSMTSWVLVTMAKAMNTRML